MATEINVDVEHYFNTAKSLIDKYGTLKIIYLRVSTKTSGQNEDDQLPSILKCFDLKEKECLIIKAKESAYQEKKQKFRILNVIPKINEKYPDAEKILYLWDLDRLYRNQDRQVNFIRESFAKNCIVLSYRQKWLYKLREVGGFGRAMYNFLIEIFGWMAEEESKKKADRLLKSLTIDEDGKFYTNRGNLFGKKYKTGSGKNITDAKYIKNLELSIIKLITEGMTYVNIKDKVFEKTNVRISVGSITNIKTRYS